MVAQAVRLSELVKEDAVAITGKQFHKITFTTALVLLTSVFIGASVQAESKHKKACPPSRGTDIVFPKKTKFQILQYDFSTDTYQVGSPDFPGEEATDVIFDELIERTPELRKDAKKLRQNPRRVLDETYMAEKDLPGLTIEELAARKGCGPTPQE